MWAFVYIVAIALPFLFPRLFFRSTAPPGLESSSAASTNAALIQYSECESDGACVDGESCESDGAYVDGESSESDGAGACVDGESSESDGNVNMGSVNGDVYHEESVRSHAIKDPSPTPEDADADADGIEALIRAQIDAIHYDSEYQVESSESSDASDPPSRKLT